MLVVALESEGLESIRLFNVTFGTSSRTTVQEFQEFQSSLIHTILTIYL